MVKDSSGNGRVRIFIVDDHPIVRYGIAKLFSPERGFEVCGSMGDVRNALAEIERVRPDIVILEISIGNFEGLEFLDALVKKHPETNVVVFTKQSELFLAEHSLEFGAKAYLVKTDSGELLLEAVSRVRAGGVYITNEICQTMLMNTIGRRRLASRLPGEVLTGREMEVLKHIGGGQKISDIARELGISPATVEYHRRHIREKLDLQSSAELSVYAVKWVQSVASRTCGKVPQT
jgi:DNA-binding NarL/FixJ family response regulator